MKESPTQKHQQLDAFLKLRDTSECLILTDGGTSCNIPARGYGAAYGSYVMYKEGQQIGTGRYEFEKGSNNFAEISIMHRALITFLHLLLDSKERRAVSQLHLCSDSRLSVRHLSRFASGIEHVAVSRGSSALFVGALVELQKIVRALLLLDITITSSWVPRAIPLRYLGH